MAWKYSKAVRRGDNVMVILVDDSDPENPQERHLNYAPVAGMSPAAFVEMVKREVDAWLRHLNAAAEEEDVTAEFDPSHHAGSGPEAVG